MKRDVAELTAAGAYAERPRMTGGRADCPTGPCPWVGCRFSLFVTLNRRGSSVKFNFPGQDIDEVGETCALRVAAKTAAIGEPLPFRKLGKYTNETYARAEQINAEAMVKFAKTWIEMYPNDPPPGLGGPLTSLKGPPNDDTRDPDLPTEDGLSRAHTGLPG